jgi:hypothetical protein
MGNHRGFAPTELIGLEIFKIFNAVAIAHHRCKISNCIRRYAIKKVKTCTYSRSEILIPCACISFKTSLTLANTPYSVQIV